jgi:hypothetical protein
VLDRAVEPLARRATLRRLSRFAAPRSASAAALASPSSPGQDRRAIMRARAVVVAVLGSACGTVNNLPADGAAGSGAPRTYKGNVAQTSPVNFGGPPPACVYTMSLRQLDIELSILTSGEVTDGRVQVLNVEGLVMPCMYLPADPTITHFTFSSAIRSPSGMTLDFDQRAGDKPGTALLIELSPTDGAYQAQMTFHRNDLGPPLDWTVVTTASLLLQ